MSELLEDHQCPKCGRNDELDVQALIWVRITEDGTDADLAEDKDHTWEDDSPIVCNSCGWQGKVKEFAVAVESEVETK